MCHSYIDQRDEHSVLSGGGTRINDSDSEEGDEKKDANNADTAQKKSIAGACSSKNGADVVVPGGEVPDPEGCARVERQRILQRKYGFKCTCLRCYVPPAVEPGGGPATGLSNA